MTRTPDILEEILEEEVLAEPQDQQPTEAEVKSEPQEEQPPEEEVKSEPKKNSQAKTKKNKILVKITI